MQPMRTHRGQVIPLDRANVDTDQIIPKQFLKRIERTGYGPFLFNDWRYDADGNPKPDFVLNREPYKHGSILLAGKNFGCGSSREHAAWALNNFGILVVIAPRLPTSFTPMPPTTACLPLPCRNPPWPNSSPRPPQRPTTSSP